jgi:hypothetical protein
VRVIRVLGDFLLYRLRYAWYGLLMPAALSQLWPARLQLASAALEIGGLVLVGAGYLDLRRHFGKKGFLEALKSYATELRAALKPPTTVQLSGTGMATAVATGTGFAVVTPPAGTPLENRVTALERAQTLLALRLQGHETAMDQALAQVDAELEAEAKRHAADVAKTHKLLEQVTVDGLGQELTGWIWLMFGAGMSFAANLAR